MTADPAVHIVGVNDLFDERRRRNEMYVVVFHRIKDPETAFARGQNLLAGNGAPAGARAVQFYPSQDQSAVTCLWEADSVVAVQAYVDSTLGDSSENICFEVDAGPARGLPELAVANV